MSKYVKQFDLPCYPDDQPQPHRRCIVGLQHGSYFEKDFKGFNIWIGGCGNGEHPGPAYAALEVLVHKVRLNLERRIDELEREKAYYVDLLRRWNAFPEQFAVPADMP